VFVLAHLLGVLPVSMDCFSSSCVLCAQCCLCLWLVCFCPVFCVPNAACVSGLFVVVLCLKICPICAVSLDCPFGVSKVYLLYTVYMYRLLEKVYLTLLNSELFT